MGIHSIQIPIEHLRDIFSYDPVSGSITRKNYSGKVGTVMKCGYIRIFVGKRGFLAHRIAWAIHYGHWPLDEIDHINMVKSDNRILNIRPANHSQNMANKMVYKNSPSGVRGVFPHGKGFRAKITRSGKQVHLGTFENMDGAEKAYMMASLKYFGEYSPYFT